MRRRTHVQQCWYSGYSPQSAKTPRHGPPASLQLHIARPDRTNKLTSRPRDVIQPISLCRRAFGSKSPRPTLLRRFNHIRHLRHQGRESERQTETNKREETTQKYNLRDAVMSDEAKQDEAGEGEKEA